MFEDFRLRVFKTVVQEGNFTKAARELGVSQPAISQNIAELEKILDVKLFLRLRGEVRLTDEGRIFDSYADRILFWYGTVYDIFRSCRKAASKSEIRIVLDGGLALNLSQGIVTFLRQINPLLAVTFCSSNVCDADITVSCKTDGIAAINPSDSFREDPVCSILCRYLSDMLR